MSFYQTRPEPSRTPKRGYVLDPETQLYHHRGDPRARALIAAEVLAQQGAREGAEYKLWVRQRQRALDKSRRIPTDYPARWELRPGQPGFNDYVSRLMRDAAHRSSSRPT